MNFLKNVIGYIGGFIVIAVFGFVVLISYEHGLISETIPQPKLSQPVKIGIYGPTETILGRENYFHVQVDGSPGKPKWELIPPIPGALTVTEDQLKARFQSSEPGTYSIIVAVGGDSHQVDIAHIEFANLPVVDTQPQDAQQPIPQSFQPHPLPKVYTVEDLVRQALAEVKTTNPVVEAAMISESINFLINRIQTGQVPPGADIIGVLASQVEEALGEDSKHWGVFLAELRAIIDTLRNQGHVSTAATTVPTLTVVMNILKSTQPASH